MLTALDYLDGDRSPTRGKRLMRIYSELDLVAAEALRQGLWDELPASGLAAALSALVFEARRPDDASRPAGPGRAGPRTPSARWCGCGASSTPSSATTGWTSCASPTWASPGRPTAGPRATTSTTCSAPPTCPPATSSGWMKQLLDLAGQVADAAGGHAGQGDRARGGAPAAARRGRLLVAGGLVSRALSDRAFLRSSGVRHPTDQEEP